MTSDFKISAPNAFASEEGELHIARVGLSVTFRGVHYAVDSEMLQPPMSIAVYFQASRAAEVEESEQILEFIKNALAFQGFNVELV